MIIKLCMLLVSGLLRVLLLPFQIALLPAEVSTIFAYVLVMLANGVGIVATYTHFGYICTLLGIVISISAFMTGYRFLMWILRKIPFLGIN